MINLRSFFRPTVNEPPYVEAQPYLEALFSPRLKIEPADVRRYWDELLEAVPLQQSLETHKGVIGKLLEKKLQGRTLWEHKISDKRLSIVFFCYMALRVAKPEVVVETGCATGWMSALILYALEKNSKGHLFSIDIPAKKGELCMDWSLPTELDPGFLVPDVLRHRWTLILGDTREHLLPLLQKHKTIDAFLHDSDHTYHHMMWEYASVWPHLKSGGVLISDDISMNSSFHDFAAGVGCTPVLRPMNRNFGAFSKP